jgi:hypothetical protein
MAWGWDTFPSYRLRRETVLAFLTEIFGYYEFFISVSMALSAPAKKIQGALLKLRSNQVWMSFDFGFLTH